MKLKESVRLLEQCEHGLRKLVAEAADEGDYASVFRITDLARAVASLTANDSLTPAPHIAPQASATWSENVGKTSPVATKGTKTLSAPRSRASIEAYPKFFRRGDELVKVGWSKKDRKEYNHRAPRGAIDAVAAKVRQVGAKGKLFNGDALLPLKYPAGEYVIPDYQAYVALAWLKHLGLVEQHGRRSGYTLALDKQIDSTIITAWTELAEWQAQ